MSWHLGAGLAQLLLVLAFSVRHLRRHRPVGDLLLHVVPMTALAVGTLAGVSFALGVAAIFYSVWLLNQALSWFARRDLVHACLATLSLAVLALTWSAATL